MTHLICLHIYEHYVKGKSDHFPENRFANGHKINTGMESLYTGNTGLFSYLISCLELRNIPNGMVLPEFPETLFSTLSCVSGPATTWHHGAHPEGR